MTTSKKTASQAGKDLRNPKTPKRDRAQSLRISPKPKRTRRSSSLPARPLHRPGCLFVHDWRPK
jgi:hypothetical protein